MVPNEYISKDTADSVQDREYALLSAMVYSLSVVNNKINVNTVEGVWRVVNYSTLGTDTVRAVSFLDLQRNQLAIAFRGTADWQDVLEDFHLGSHGKLFPKTIMTAKKFVEQEVALANSYLAECPCYTSCIQPFLGFFKKKKTVNVVLTGHSLGGAIARTVGIDLALPSTVFDPPGIFGAGPTENAAKRIRSYVSRPNLVNTFGKHYGEIFYVPFCSGKIPAKPIAKELYEVSVEFILKKLKNHPLSTSCIMTPTMEAFSTSSFSSLTSSSIKSVTGFIMEDATEKVIATLKSHPIDNIFSNMAQPFIPIRIEAHAWMNSKEFLSIPFKALEEKIHHYSLPNLFKMGK